MRGVLWLRTILDCPWSVAEGKALCFRKEQGEMTPEAKEIFGEGGRQ